MTVSALFPRLLLAAGPLLATGLAQAGPMQDIGTGSGPQCAGGGVNNSGYTVGVCAESDGMASGFVALAPGSAVDLGRLTASRSCSAGAVTNSGRVIGSCLNGDSLSTAVVWNATAPTTVQALQPSGGVRSKATAYNQSGVVAGLSVNANGTVRPVMWPSNQTTAQTLPGDGLLGLDTTNCVPADVDDVASNPARPQIVGNCPGSNGKPQAVLWSNGLLSYAATLLALPSGALYCAASQISNARILGHCDFGAQGGRTALWTTPASAPLLLTTIPARNSGSDLNANGGVVGQYMDSNGDSIPFYWDTTTNTRTDIPALAGGFNVSVTAIGDNGNVVGTSETGTGTSRAIRWTPVGGTVDLGTLGGKNSAPLSLSQDGCYLAGVSEVLPENASRAFVQNICTP